ncbi:MAG: hypothetical protein IKB25_12250 [Lentisphaeria bacterium]|nr:hypothetical protein [Lentisphaeria bacterium]
MKKLLITAVTAAFFGLNAEIVNSNGDFEKCKADKAGNLMPEGWGINKGLSKKFTLTMAKEKEDVHGGNFAMETETEGSGTLFLINWKAIPVKTGDTLKFTIYAKGEGTFRIGYLMHGVPEGAKNSVFLWTVASKGMKPVEGEYKQFTYTAKISPLIKNKKLHHNVSAFPVLIIDKNSNILLDDLVVDLTKAPGK